MKVLRAVLLLFSAAILAGSIMAAPPQSSSPAVIVNSGSTNTVAYRITVDRSGDAVCTITSHTSGQDGGRPQTIRRKLPLDLTQKLFSDLETAKPLARLPAARCLKSASFGTRVSLVFEGEETPDLSCPNQQNSRAGALRRDTDQVIDIFHLNTGKRPPLPQTVQ